MRVESDGFNANKLDAKTIAQYVRANSKANIII
jgi:hypothetical protein